MKVYSSKFPGTSIAWHLVIKIPRALDILKKKKSMGSFPEHLDDIHGGGKSLKIQFTAKRFRNDGRRWTSGAVLSWET